MKGLVLKTKNNEKCLTRYQNDPRYKMRELNKFIDDLNRLKLFDQIVDIISKDEKYLEFLLVGKDKAKEHVEKNIKNNFKKLFSECSDEGKKQIVDIISQNLDFSDYFAQIDDDLYDNYKVSELLKDENIKNKDEIVRSAFDSQKGNKLLIITFFAQKKVEEKGFLENLEKNYGIYLDVDTFIKEMKDKLEEIKTFKQFFEYLGSDLAKDKTDMELLIEYYDKAKDKDYLKNFDDSRNNNHHNFSGRENRGRGDRGRGRGHSFRGRGFRGGYNRGGFRGRGYYRSHRGGRYNRGRGRNEGPRSRSYSRSRSRSHSRNWDEHRD
jgi:hypothetical protein